MSNSDNFHKATDRPDWLTYVPRPKAYSSIKRSESAKRWRQKRREKKGKA